MIKLAFLNLFRRKSRTILSLIGIAIGVGVIISLVSVVDGTYNEFNSIVSQFQGIITMEKDSLDQTLSSVDASLGKKFEQINGIRTVVSEIWLLPTRLNGKALGMEEVGLSTPFVYGVDMSEYNKLRGNGWLGEMYKGEMLKPNDFGKVVIGKKLYEDEDIFLGTVLKIDEKNFTVKGVLKTESDLIGNVMMISLSDAREMSDLETTKVSSYYLELINPKEDKKVKKLIEFKHGDEIDAYTASSFSEEFGSVLGNFRLVVFLIAALSAIVASIGIINTILISVMERRKEIGALKATGWNDGSVMKMIMFESLFMGLLGGVIGLALGFIAAFVMQTYLGLKPFITIELVLQAYFFALALGLLAGIYPAYKALKLSPVEAMR